MRLRCAVQRPYAVFPQPRGRQTRPDDAIPAQRINELNGNIVGEIELIARRP